MRVVCFSYFLDQIYSTIMYITTWALGIIIQYFVFFRFTSSIHHLKSCSNILHVLACLTRWRRNIAHFINNWTATKQMTNDIGTNPSVHHLHSITLFYLSLHIVLSRYDSGQVSVTTWTCFPSHSTWSLVCMTVTKTDSRTALHSHSNREHGMWTHKQEKSWVTWCWWLLWWLHRHCMESLYLSIFSYTWLGTTWISYKVSGWWQIPGCKLYRWGLDITQEMARGEGDWNLSIRAWHTSTHHNCSCPIVSPSSLTISVCGA